jgi:hypothetical protein
MEEVMGTDDDIVTEMISQIIFILACVADFGHDMGHAIIILVEEIITGLR